jgi:hypothetical protein
MEGLAEDADLLFVLTTNRPDLIEPALAARPGRVDLALDELLDDRAALTRRLLGQPADGAAPTTPVGPTYGPMVHATGAAGLPLPPEIQGGGFFTSEGGER